MKHAKFWCSLAIVALSSAYAGGCSAIYASCSQDSDCDLVRGEVFPESLRRQDISFSDSSPLQDMSCSSIAPTGTKVVPR